MKTVVSLWKYLCRLKQNRHVFHGTSIIADVYLDAFGDDQPSNEQKLKLFVPKRSL